jgi:hypothetical protein
MWQGEGEWIRGKGKVHGQGLVRAHGHVTLGLCDQGHEYDS